MLLSFVLMRICSNEGGGYFLFFVYTLPLASYGR